MSPMSRPFRARSFPAVLLALFVIGLASGAAAASLPSCALGSIRVVCTDDPPEQVSCESVACDGTTTTTHADTTRHACDVQKCFAEGWQPICSFGVLIEAYCSNSTSACPPGCLNPVSFTSIASTRSRPWNNCEDPAAPGDVLAGRVPSLQSNAEYVTALGALAKEVSLFDTLDVLNAFQAGSAISKGEACGGKTTEL